MGFIPLTERSGINFNDRTLDEGIRTNEFVIRGIVDDTNDTGLLGARFASPSKVSSFETESSILEVSYRD